MRNISIKSHAVRYNWSINRLRGFYEICKQAGQTAVNIKSVFSENHIYFINNGDKKDKCTT